MSINPIWLLICLSGLWLARNFSDQSVGNLHLRSTILIVGFAGYLLLAGWLVLLPASFIEQFRTYFFYLSPLNLLLGITFLLTDIHATPDKHRSLKYIIRDIAIAYMITFFALAFLPLFTD
jgi:hypothetical protein